MYFVSEADRKNLFKRVRNNIGQANKELKSVSAMMWVFLGKIKATLDKT